MRGRVRRAFLALVPAIAMASVTTMASPARAATFLDHPQSGMPRRSAPRLSRSSAVASEAD